MVTFCARRCVLSARLLSKAMRRPYPVLTRLFSQTNHICYGTPSIYRLDGRGIVRVAGRDTVDLMQGLVTSDVTEFTDVSQDLSAQYCMMLNVQGRVMFDLIIYNYTKLMESVSFLVECDSSLKEDFIKTVKRYRIRKKVDISDVSDEYTVWAIAGDLDPTELLYKRQQDSVEGIKNINVPEAVFNVPDPRVPLFGQRVIFKRGEETLVKSNAGSEPYDSLRYRWGIPEGSKDLPPGNCLPLESNLTIMNGVSFLKGCYIGQELTARTHHTGVIRKRLMPLVFESEASVLESNTQISTDKGKNAGKVRGTVGKVGLGLLRLEHHDKPLFAGPKDGDKVPLSAYIPGWWPEELQKH